MGGIVTIDFSEYDPGLISLVGRNGAGKTTLIENLHPWPQMLTRKGKLQDHFRLRDSFRDLYFSDTAKGIQYRALLQIDGQNKSGGIEYYLYSRPISGGDFQPLPDMNGRQAPYMDKIEQIFGSLSLYLKSAFISQKPTKNNPDITDTTDAEKKSLFSELSGIDYLGEFSRIANEKAKKLESQSIELAADVRAGETLDAELADANLRIKNGQNLIYETEKKLRDEDQNLSIAKVNMDQAQETVQKNIQYKSELDTLKKQCQELNESIINSTSRKEDYEKAVYLRKSAEDKLKEAEESDKKLKELNGKRSEIISSYDKLVDSWKVKRADQDELLSDINRRIQAIRDDKRSVNSSIEIANNAIQQTSYSIDVHKKADSCPTCGQKYSEGSESWNQIQEKIKSLEKELQGYQIVIKNNSGLIDKHDLALSDLEKQIFSPDPMPEKPDTSEIDEKIKDITDWSPSETDIKIAREQISKSDTANAIIEELNASIKNNRSQIQNIEPRITELHSFYDPTADEKLNEAKEEHSRVQKSINDLNEQVSRYRAKIEELETQAKTIQSKIDVIQDKREQLIKIESEAADYRFLEKATGRDGIQALELDALAPSIADKANEILEQSYGSRFAIEFHTQRESGSGSKSKQIESFDIMVRDNYDGTIQNLDTLSGGESVWIKKAIYDAFGIIRERNRGLRFLTAFADESDDGLDPDAKQSYFRMLEAAHGASNREKTIVITHSREIQQMIGQSIDITELE
jgi:exonuclease SbcC